MGAAYVVSNSTHTCANQCKFAICLTTTPFATMVYIHLVIILVIYLQFLLCARKLDCALFFPLLVITKNKCNFGLKI